MTKILLIACGGAVGSVLRFLLSEKINAHSSSNFPYAIIAINILGCFLMGVAAGFFEKTSLPYEAKLFITVGMLGGFTTFSAFSLDAMMLVEQGRIADAVIYIFSSVAFSLLGFFIGNNILKLV